ncbi:hypothetical protein PG999_002499 [Apiospora kogelbergensis]|uniref:Trafficking protein particle complex subunit 13 n=1 Tax=Apiospora kogelbergensis TaxID=1337665 RepID=A0AAW0R8C1_9PEZI
MSHQRYPSMDPVKEPHSVSLKVLRYSIIESPCHDKKMLSRPSLVTQHTLAAPSELQPAAADAAADHLVPASLAYRSTAGTNPDPFLLTPILNLPPSFGSAYVGETFSCTLCANQDIPPEPPATTQQSARAPAQKKSIREVKIEAEMKTPGSATVQKLLLGPSGGGSAPATQETGAAEGTGGIDLDAGQTLQKIVNFDLTEEGNHVLAVTVSYYEATETSGRTRTFRKLYQFVCKGSLIVRTKVGPLPYNNNAMTTEKGPDEQQQQQQKQQKRRWIMEAQLENCSEDTMQLERVVLNLETGLRYRDANWIVSESARPVLHPGEVEQVCFVVEEDGKGTPVVEDSDGRVVFGVLGIGWRTEMGNRGFLATGKLGARNTR